jgi:flagellar biosynthetic protein FlhB
MGGAQFLGFVLPLAVLVVLVAAGASLMQTGVFFKARWAAPRLDRLSPASGLARVFSTRSFGRGGFAALKGLSLGLALAWGLAPLFSSSSDVSAESLLSRPFPATAAAGLDHVLRVFTWAAAGLVALGLLDWLFQRVELERDLRMTRQEAIDELKDQEGDPRLKGRRRGFGKRLRAGPSRQAGGGER